jgi:hypothetical protein
MNATQPKTADQILLSARLANPGHSTGTYTHGRAVVTYDRLTRRYEVGTVAVALVEKAKRSAAIPVIHAILDGGCVTAEQVHTYFNRMNDGIHWK